MDTKRNENRDKPSDCEDVEDSEGKKTNSSVDEGDEAGTNGEESQQNDSGSVKCVTDEHSGSEDDNGNGNDDDDDDDDLSMYGDDDDDEAGLYGDKRNRPDFSTGAPPGSFEMYALNRKELEDRRVRHHEIIRQILADFDIEEVKEKYRGKGLVRDFSHANRKFRMWLEKVMGNDKIQLCDSKWQELFRQKVMEDYEHKLKERERQLAEAEVQRIQRLRLQGILTSDDPRAKVNGHKHGTRSKKKSQSSLSDHSSKHQHLYSRPQDDIETQMDIINKDNNNRSKGTRTPSTPRDTAEDQGEERGDGNSQENGSEDDQNNKENITTESLSNNGHLGMSGSIRPARNPHIQSLYQEEDLQQLYACAEELLRRTKSTPSK